MLIIVIMIFCESFISVRKVRALLKFFLKAYNYLFDRAWSAGLLKMPLIFVWQVRDSLKCFQNIDNCFYNYVESAGLNKMPLRCWELYLWFCVNLLFLCGKCGPSWNYFWRLTIIFMIVREVRASWRCLLKFQFLIFVW